MHGLSDTDWEALSAYHDGEMSAKARADLEARLAQEPALAEALAEITELGDGLRRLHPLAATEETAPAPAANLPRPPARLLRIGGSVMALAACLALAIAIGSALHDSPPLPRALHQELSAIDLSTTELSVAGPDADPQITPAALGAWPDLGAARLTHVALRDIPGGAVAHYSGVNGCRLSYFRTRETPDLSGPDQDGTARWQTADGQHHLLLATGMDTARFDAIAAYLEHLSRGAAAQSQLAALSDKTRAATPCLG